VSVLGTVNTFSRDRTFQRFELPISFSNVEVDSTARADARGGRATARCRATEVQEGRWTWSAAGVPGGGVRKPMMAASGPRAGRRAPLLGPPDGARSTMPMNKPYLLFFCLFFFFQETSDPADRARFGSGRARRSSGVGSGKEVGAGMLRTVLLINAVKKITTKK